MIIKRDEALDLLIIDAFLTRHWREQYSVGEYDVVLAREYVNEFRGHTVGGQAFITAPSCFYDFMEDIKPRIWWSPESGDHPHILDDNTLCYSLPGVLSTLRQVWEAGRREEAIEIFADILTKLPEQFTPNSIASSAWVRCGSCDEYFHKSTLLYCQCGRAICSDCLGGAEQYVCETCFPNMPHAARHALLLEDVVLVGVGVTGSWVSQVLLKSAAYVWVWDPDWIGPGNAASGAWRCADPEYKVHTLEGPGYRFYRAFTQPFTEQTEVPSDSWVVICTDSANSRLTVLEAVRNRARGIIDFRVAPSALTVWAFRTDDEEMVKAYVDSLQGYPVRQPCAEDGAHDNVPLMMGVLASAFFAWWVKTKPTGVWVVPAEYGEAWRTL